MAGNVSIDYSISVSANGATVPLGTMVLDYDGSSYSLESLLVTLPKKSAIVTSDMTLVRGSGHNRLLPVHILRVQHRAAEKFALHNFRPVAHDTEHHALHILTGQRRYSLSAAIERAALPEPASWALMLMGLGSIGTWMRRRRPTVRSAA